MNKIMENLYIGNILEAIKYGEDFDIIINCMGSGEAYSDEKKGYNVLKHPILIRASTYRLSADFEDDYADPYTMDFIAKIIHDTINSKKILVHCAAGEERSPLAVIWYIHKYSNMNIDDSYEFIRKQHPQTLDRRSWLRKCLNPDGYVPFST